MGIVKTNHKKRKRERKGETERRRTRERQRKRGIDRETNRHRVKEANAEDGWAGRHMTNKQTDGERGGRGR